MEYSGRHILDNRTEETLKKLKLQEPDCKIYKKVLKNWDSIAKPLDGMGRFETITAQIGAILGTDKIDISKKAVIIMCADNGIVEEGISQSGQEVTAAVAEQMGRGASSVGIMAAVIGADTIPVDIGINGKEQITGVINKKVRHPFLSLHLPHISTMPLQPHYSLLYFQSPFPRLREFDTPFFCTLPQFLYR